jgi:hypothetical protein
VLYLQMQDRNRLLLCQQNSYLSHISGVPELAAYIRLGSILQHQSAAYFHSFHWGI